MAARPLLLLLTALSASPVGATAGTPLRGMGGLTRAYSAILDADFEGAARLIDEACPPAPVEACLTLEATRLLWRIQIDPEQTRFDPLFVDASERAIAAADDWAEREPGSAEAWFYVGGAYGARVQWRVLRRQHLGAARDGKRVKQALDQALVIDPSLADAQFGIGLYEYYADVAPTSLKVLRFLLLLPGGNRARGLARMREAESQGALLAEEAAYQLQLVYLWYEGSPHQALTILRHLAARHPRNPYFERLVADTLDVYLHDVSASLDAYGRLLTLAESHAVNEPELADAEARLGMAAALDALGDTDRAVELLVPLVARDPTVPFAAAARARLALAKAYDRLGDWARAEALLTEVTAHPPVPDPMDLEGAARRALQRPTASSRGEAHRLALESWRRFERDQSAIVEPAFEKALALDPQNRIARYRYGRVLAVHQQPERALAAFEAVVRAAGSTPPAILAEAALAAARLRERAHDPIGAIALYKRAAYAFGASARTREAAAHALARLAPATPRP